MKRFLMIAAMLTLTVSAFAQAQFTTKKEKLSDFTRKTTKVVLPGPDFIDYALREAVRSVWTVSAYEYCTLEEFEALKKSSDYYFLIPTALEGKKESGMTSLTLVKGGGRPSEISDMLEVARIPVCATDSPSGREMAFMPALTDILQEAAVAAVKGSRKGVGAVTAGLKAIGDMRVCIAVDDLASGIGAIEAGKIELMDADDVDAVFMDGEDAVVSYTVVPDNAGKGSVCYNMLIGARDHRLYYFRKRTMSSAADAGFSASEIKAITSRK
ncbi:MAG: hypothetical protein VZQ27_04180 [Candidatus Cryptobacteroides sp.]|nr:hypothetical protein [Candidatus Cryptobacteroides sp.]